jgi:ABC-type multidrug transport system ATPase subunit
MEKRKQPASVAVQCEQVSCRIGKRTILDQISLNINLKEITGILGPNGAGKTTLLNALAGLRQLSGGTITVLNEKLPSRSSQLRQRIGMVFQETALYEELTTLENLRFATSLYHVPRPRIEEVLHLLDLTERAKDRVSTLSGGFRRRIALARALLHSPDLLLIDEPTLGVDVEARHAIWAHLRLLKADGTTIIVSTNYLDEALALCDTVAVLRAGQLLVSEKPEKLVARTGSCLDIECSLTAAEAIAQALSEIKGILRIDQTPSGVSVFLDGRIVPDDVMRLVLEAAAITGFRTRSADLAEVFRALEEVKV